MCGWHFKWSRRPCLLVTLASFPADVGSPSHPLCIFNPSPPDPAGPINHGSLGFDGQSFIWNEERGCGVGDTANYDDGLNCPSPSGEIDAEQTWACPFFKFDPKKYSECLGRHRLRRINDVKQHILRRHILSDHHCPKCWKQWLHETPCEEHIRNQNCQSVPGPESLNQQEHQDFKRIRFPVGLGDEQKWALIWRKLFVGHQVPPSPYVRNSFDEVIQIARSYSKADLQQKLSDILWRHGVNTNLVSTPTLIDEIMTASYAIPSTAIAFRYRRHPPNEEILEGWNSINTMIKSSNDRELSIPTSCSSADHHDRVTNNRNSLGSNYLPGFYPNNSFIGQNSNPVEDIPGCRVPSPRLLVAMEDQPGVGNPNPNNADCLETAASTTSW